MKENKIYFSNYKEKKSRDYVFYANQIIKDRDRDSQRHEKSHEVETQYDFRRDNLICTCRKGKISKRRPDIRQFRHPKEIYAYHEGSRSFTDIRVGSVKALLKKKVKKIYDLETDHKGCGSNDRPSFIMQRAKQNKVRNYYECKTTSSKCVGGILEYNTTCTMSEKLSPMNQTVTASTSAWKGTYTNAEVGSNIITRLLINTTTQVDNTGRREIGIDVDATEEPKDERKSDERVVIDTIKPIVNINTNGKKPSAITNRKIKLLDKYSSDSLVQHVYDLEYSSYAAEKPSRCSNPAENKLEKEYKIIFKPKPEESNPKKPNASDNKSASFKRGFEALRKGFVKKDEPQKNSLQLSSLASISVTSHRDVSIMSDPPSLEARSFSQTKIYSPHAFPSIVEHDRANIYYPELSYKSSVTGRHAKNRPYKSKDEDYESQGVKGMFKIWGEKFNLDGEEYVKISSPIPSIESLKKALKPKDEPLQTQSKPIAEEDKNKRKFLCFKKKYKEKEKIKGDKSKSKKCVTTGRCEVKDKLLINKCKNVHKPQEKLRVKKPDKVQDVIDETTKGLWLQKFLSHAIDSRNSVKVRWKNNKTYNTSSSTVFELIDNVYKDTGIVFRSKSDINVQSSHYKYHTRRKNVNFAQQNIQAWMMQRSVPDRILMLPILQRELIQSKNGSMEVTISNQKWVIDKSKAFSRKIEVVLHSKNIVARNRENSSDYLRIDIPNGFFVHSSEASADDSNKQNQSSDEQVYIVEYETENNIKTENNNRELNTDNHKETNIGDTVDTKSIILIDTAIETPTADREIAVKNSIRLPKRCGVIEVGVITQTDKKNLKTEGRKPILKIRDGVSDCESEGDVRQRRRKCDFAENYLQEYYRHLTNLDQDMLPYVSDSHFQCCSQTSKRSFNQQEEESQSCPNMFKHFQTLRSSVEATKTVCLKKCYENPNSEDPNKSWYSGLKTKFAGIKQSFEPFAIKRVHPKDSIAVAKKRKLYATTCLKSQWRSDSSEVPACNLPTGDSFRPIKEQMKPKKPFNTEIPPCLTSGTCPSLENVKTSSDKLKKPPCDLTTCDSLRDNLDTPPCTLTTCGSSRNKPKKGPCNLETCDSLRNNLDAPPCTLTTCGSFPNGMVISTDKLQLNRKPKDGYEPKKNKGMREKHVSIEDFVDVRPNSEMPGILSFKIGPIKEPIGIKVSGTGIANRDSQMSRSSKKPTSPHPCSPGLSPVQLQPCELPRQSLQLIQSLERSPLRSPPRTLSPKEQAALQLKISTYQPDLGQMPALKIQNNASSENIPSKEPFCKASPCMTPTKAKHCEPSKTSNRTPLITQHCEPSTTSNRCPASRTTKCCCGSPSNESFPQTEDRPQTKKPHSPQICTHPLPPCPRLPDPPLSCACAEPIETPKPCCRSCPTCSNAGSSGNSYPNSKSFPSSSHERVSSEQADPNEQCCVRHPCQDSSLSCKSHQQQKSGLEKLLSMLPPSLSKLCKPKQKSQSIESGVSSSDDNPCLKTLISASKTHPCSQCHSPPQQSPPATPAFKLSKTPSVESICPKSCRHKKQKTKDCAPCCPASPKRSTSSTKFKLSTILKRFSPIMKCSSSKMSLPPSLSGVHSVPSPIEKPKLTGVHLKMVPVPISPKRSCPICCTALHSEDQITIRMKKQTPSTEEIRESMNIKVQDEDGVTLYERKDYTSPMVLNNDRVKSCVVGDIYQQSQVHRVQKCTTPLIEQIDANKDCHKEISEIKSATSIANIIEIEFKLKVTPGDKTAEINIGDDEINSNSNNKKRSQRDLSPQEVFVLKKDGADDELSGKNDINIRIVIKNFKSKSDRNQSLKDKDYSDEFANQITDKFRSVSTGYNDIDQDHVFSRHRATVDLSSSVEKRRMQRSGIKASETNIKTGIGNVFATEYICTHSSANIDNNSRNIEKQSTYSIMNKNESYSNVVHEEAGEEKTATVIQNVETDVKQPGTDIEKPDTSVMTHIIDVIRQGIAITGQRLNFEKSEKHNNILQKTDIEQQEKDVECIDTNIEKPNIQVKVQEADFKSQNSDDVEKTDSNLEKQETDFKKPDSVGEISNLDKDKLNADGIQEIDPDRNKTCIQRLNIFFKRPDKDIHVSEIDFEKQGDDMKRSNDDIDKGTPDKDITERPDTNIVVGESPKDSKGHIENDKIFSTMAIEKADSTHIENLELDAEKQEMKSHTDIERPNTDNEIPDTENEMHDTDIERYETDIERYDTDQERYETDQERLDTDIERPDTEIERPNTDIERPNTDIEQPDIDIERPDTDIEKLDTDLERHETELDPKYDTAVTTDTDDLGKIKPHTKKEKKEMLKKVLKKAQNKSKSEVKKLLNKLNVILTSDSSEPDDRMPSNLSRNVTYASLKPNYFRDSDSINKINNYFRVESSGLLSDKERNKEMLCPPGNNSFSSNLSDSDFSDSDTPLAPRPGTGCLCSTVAEKLKMASRMDNEGGGCCCAKRKPVCCSFAKSKDVCCDLAQSSNYFQPKPIECVHVETQNSKNSVCRHTSTCIPIYDAKSISALPIIENQGIKMDLASKTGEVKTNSSNKPEMKRPKNDTLTISDESKMFPAPDSITTFGDKTEIGEEDHQCKGYMEQDKEGVVFEPKDIGTEQSLNKDDNTINSEDGVDNIEKRFTVDGNVDIQCTLKVKQGDEITEIILTNNTEDDEKKVPQKAKNSQDVFRLDTEREITEDESNDYINFRLVIKSKDKNTKTQVKVERNE